MKATSSQSVPRRATSMSRLGAALCAALAMVAAPASATIIGGAVVTPGAAFLKLTVPLANPFGPPNSVGNNTFQSPNLFGFDEDQNILLAAALNVDVGPSPIAAGTTVASHYIFFDPVSGSIDGTVDFDSKVLAIITSTGLLLASDFLANTGVNYLNPAARGLEPGDSVTISGANQIHFVTTAGTPGDYVRVLTEFSPAAVPAPGVLSLLAAAALAAAGLARRRVTR